MDAWAPWQRAYRFGVVLIYPPEPIRSMINALRTKYDPTSQKYCDAHISLSVPAPSAPTAEQWTRLEALLSTVSPLRIEYGPPKRLATHPGVVLHVEPKLDLEALRATVESVEPFASAPPRRWPFSPHMTIAELITLERSDEVMEELEPLELRGELTCEHLSYAVPDSHFHFVEQRKLWLGRVWH